jgi:hypothetical protein
MFIRLLPTQISAFWETIKYGCVKADEVREEDMPRYFNELLHALLNDKAQCFVILDEQKILLGFFITRIIVNKFSGRKELFGQIFYSMRSIIDEEAIKYVNVLSQFAAKEDCCAFTFSSRNFRIWELAKVTGCEESSRNFELMLGA